MYAWKGNNRYQSISDLVKNNSYLVYACQRLIVDRRRITIRSHVYGNGPWVEHRMHRIGQGIAYCTPSDFKSVEQRYRRKRATMEPVLQTRLFKIRNQIIKD